MSNKINSQLIIKTKIWEKETFELIDYLNDETINSKFEINSPGVLCRNEKKISFIQGENLSPTESNLLKIEKNSENGKYIINCGNWSKDLSKLIEEQGAFLVYRGFSLQELNKNYNYRYYKLSQGDIFKIGRVYFKVLDIHLKNGSSEVKSNNESVIKGTMIRSSSCNSIIINGQQIIKGAFFPGKTKMLSDKLHHSINENNFNNNSVLTIKNSNYKKNESLKYYMYKKDQLLPKISFTNELIQIQKKQKNKYIEKKEIKNLKSDLVSNKPKNVVNKSKPVCRICYGEDTNEDNPLICPCICKGSMKYIHYECLKNWLNSKIEDEISIDTDSKDIDVISYNRKDISCELCKEKFPDYIKHNNLYYNISFYKPKFEEFIVLESMKADKEKVKYIHLLSFDNKLYVNIGRANECELSIAELSVSRYHCMIHKEDGELFLEDNSSKFGTLILVQNNKLIMNDYIPLRLQINKTFIKIKAKTSFSFNCCGCQNIYESKRYDYQLQNRKCFDILSYFLIKEDDTNLDNNEYEIEDNTIKNVEEDNKQLIDVNDEEEKNNKNKIKLKVNEKEEKSLTKNEIYSYLHVNQHSTRLKKLNIKKAINDNLELPKLDKINIQNFRDSISLISARNNASKMLYNYQQNKQQISLIRINRDKTNFDKTHSQSQTNNIVNINEFQNSSTSKVIKDYNHKKNK